MNHLFKQCLASRISLMFFFGMASGLPLALIGSTLQAWYTVEGVSTLAIGFLSLIGQPYIFKFIWAPLFDRFQVPFLGRRRGWILLTQISLIIVLVFISTMSPSQTPIGLAMLALALAFFSASQDISIDAYRAEILLPIERGLGNAFFITGYRIGVLFAGAFALILASRFNWHLTYLVMAGFMGINVIATFLSEEPDNPNQTPLSLYQAIVLPFADFLKRDKAWLILIFIVTYKLGDAFSLTLNSTFLLRGLHFSLIELGLASKSVSIVATIVGALLGGLIQTRIGLFRSLLLFGMLQAISNSGFMILAMVGHNLPLMMGVVGLEHLSSGMGTVAFLGFLMSLCDQRYTATQFALLSALSAVGRVYVGPIAGIVVSEVGWVVFYFFAFLTALPGIALLWPLRSLSVFREKPTFAPFD